MEGSRTPEIPRGQLGLWAGRREDALPDNHHVRHLDVLLGPEAFADTLREMERSNVLNRGKPPCHPHDLAVMEERGIDSYLRDTGQNSEAAPDGEAHGLQTGDARA